MTTTGLLGDTPQKTYTTKLDRFNRFAEPELRALIANLALEPTATILDAGCGTGLITGWLAAHAPRGSAIGLDLATQHVRHAGTLTRQDSTPERRGIHFLQSDMIALPFQPGTFDLIWSSNAINHLHRPVEGLRRLAELLRPDGRLVLGQSAFLPEMFFAWDARLEKEVMLACRQYYRDKYHLNERDTTHVRNLLGLLQQAGLRQVRPTTTLIERTAPLSAADEAYFVEGVFNGYWGHRVQPYLSAADWAELSRLCDPASLYFAPRRPDFHHLQTFTLAIGHR